MKTLKTLFVVMVCSSIFSIASFADEFGTRDEAANLLERCMPRVNLKGFRNHRLQENSRFGQYRALELKKEPPNLLILAILIVYVEYK